MTPPPDLDSDRLVETHLHLVTRLVREATGRLPAHVNHDDLTSAGMFALIQAARAFDAERGVPFPRYAATRIRGAVLDELRGVDWASRSVRRLSRDLDATRSQLATTLGRVPTNEEVASVLGVGVADIARNDDDVARAQVLSLHGTPDSDLEELLPTGGPTPDQVLEDRERLIYLVEAIAELPERLRILVQDYFFIERPMAQIAEELGVTESRVSQMRAEALGLLRDVLQRELEPEMVRESARPRGCAARRRETYFAAVASRHALTLRKPVHAHLDSPRSPDPTSQDRHARPQEVVRDGQRTSLQNIVRPLAYTRQLGDRAERVPADDRPVPGTLDLDIGA